jgi:cytochrome o ubiquinol oxidase subunit 1
MQLFASLFGRLTWSSLPHEPITIGGAILMVLLGVGVAGLLTYFKRWTWLYREWLTAQDPKKIGGHLPAGL